MHSNNELFNSTFSHIYIEERVKQHPKTLEILQHFPNSTKISISHYKDVFNRKRQTPTKQRQAKSLILAAKESRSIYPGAPVCQGFGQEYFYYCATAMNCIFDCDYCYLKGMYPTANLVLFVDQENIFQELDTLLQQHPVYLCIAYDTDLMAYDHLTGFLKQWQDYTLAHPNLTIEIRTKAAPKAYFPHHIPNERIIYAFTLSPDEIIQQHEHFTPSLQQRIDCIQQGIQLGFSIRLCFDPMIYVKNWRSCYDQMLHHVINNIPLTKVRDISIGSFRISQDYMKAMRKSDPHNAIVQFPYENDHGVYHYNHDITHTMEDYLLDKLSPYFQKQQIFLWDHQ